MPRPAVPLLALSLCLAMRATAQAPLFRPAPGSPVLVGATPSRVILADLDGDGDPDMVTSHSQAHRITIRLGDGAGGFAASAGSPILREYAPGDIAVGDVDGDRVPDLAMTRSDRDVVEILRGDGRGGFRLDGVASVVVSGSTYWFTRFLHLVDLNEDGRLDLVTATDGRDAGSAPTVMLGDGRGGFSAGPALTPEPGGGSYSFAFADVDGDGHLDLVIASRAPDASQADGGVVVRRGDGRGGFHAAGAPLPVPSGPRLGALADVNGDGRPDLVLAHGGLSLLSVLLNTGGSFAPAPGSPYDAAPQAFGIAVADVNHDARADILAATVQNQTPPYESGLTVLLGGGGRFVAAPGSPVPTGPGSYRLTVGDVDGDGKLDVLAPSGAGDGVTILLGR